MGVSKKKMRLAEMSVDYREYDDYTADNETEKNFTKFGPLNFSGPRSAFTSLLVAFNVVICVVGLAGNSLVIWICGWKMKRTVPTTWYMSLAISNLLFCIFLPLELIYMMTSHWPFGLVLCKLMSSALFLNMYSSVFLLVLISVDRCVVASFPVWSRNHRTVRRASALVVLTWLLSALLTLPSLIHRRTAPHGAVTLCVMHYADVPGHKAVVLTRFTCGFLLPFLAIVLCSTVLGAKLRGMSIKSTKPYKIMAALILCFFVCWVPYHTFVLLEIHMKSRTLESFRTGMKVGVTLAASNSFVAPVLYIFVGNDFSQILRSSLTQRFESVMAEDFRTGGLGYWRDQPQQAV
ncbi:C3a anaphylatoxin chemotactic receptor-like isoform X2 [Entelurus aequoreus]|uniref:C3a anaphylatoxin chemotactic receptor-like isoform X2 n=1 Tax=Entelurus aequoreus TaxID=161455 RepID=UPI002B1E2A9F|nr:C3a anaphylatoxin chemotactic receptor-like isoform X2 [Entelurus aequoreus]